MVSRAFRPAVTAVRGWRLVSLTLAVGLGFMACQGTETNKGTGVELEQPPAGGAATGRSAGEGDAPNRPGDPGGSPSSGGSSSQAPPGTGGAGGASPTLGGMGGLGGAAPLSEQQMCQRRLAECGAYLDAEFGLLDCGQCEDSTESCITNRCEPSCGSEYGPGPTEGLVLHVRSEFSDEDVSENRIPVEVKADQVQRWSTFADAQWYARTDHNVKSLDIDLSALDLGDEFTVAFRFVPDSLKTNGPLATFGGLSVEQAGASLQLSSGGSTTLSSANLVRPSCNHVAVVSDGTSATLYSRAKAAAQTINGSDIDLRHLQFGRYAGRVWDIRVYDHALNADDVTEVAELCAEERVGATWVSGFPEYECGTYHCVFHPAGMTTPRSDIDYFVWEQDRRDELMLLVSGRYPHDNFCDFYYNYEADFPNPYMRIRAYDDDFYDQWVHGATQADPWSQHALHETTHGYQAWLTNYQGRGLPRWLLESDANYGVMLSYPHRRHDAEVLASTTLQPFLPLVTQSGDESFFEPGIVTVALGAQAYGNYIFLSYLANYVTGPSFIGFVENGAADYSRLDKFIEVLESGGHDIREVFADYAARTAVWDYDDRDNLIATEADGLVLLESKDTKGWPAAEFDNKRSGTYGSSGTDGLWVSVPAGHRPHSFGYNSYEFTVEKNTTYRVALRTAENNPEHGEYRARIVLEDELLGTFDYLPLAPATPGEEASVVVQTGNSTKMYLVFAVVPLQGWETPLGEYNFVSHGYFYRVDRLAN